MQRRLVPKFEPCFLTTLIVGCTQSPAQGDALPGSARPVPAAGAPNIGGTGAAYTNPVAPDRGAGGAATRAPLDAGAARASGGPSTIIDAARLPPPRGEPALVDAGASATAPRAGAALPDAGSCRPGTTLTADGNCLLGTSPGADGGCPAGTATSLAWYSVPECKAYVDCVVASLCAVSTVQDACEAAARDKLQASNCFPANAPISSDEWTATCERERKTLVSEFPACASK